MEEREAVYCYWKIKYLKRENQNQHTNEHVAAAAEVRTNKKKDDIKKGTSRQIFANNNNNNMKTTLGNMKHLKCKRAMMHDVPRTFTFSVHTISMHVGECALYFLLVFGVCTYIPVFKNFFPLFYRRFFVCSDKKNFNKKKS